MDLLKPQDIRVAAQLLRKGELVAFPTETVYGLGALLSIPEAIRKIFKAKGRPTDNPLIIHVSDLKQARSLCASIPPYFEILAGQFWPGPLTLVVPKAAHISALAAAGLQTIGIRVPAHPLARALIQEVGPLVAPSANLSGRPSATQVAHVQQDFEGKIAAVLEGECGLGLESTVVLLGSEPIILRPGPISAELLRAFLKCDVREVTSSATPQAPGMKYRHYAPTAALHLCFSSEEVENAKRRHPHAKMVIPTPETLYQQLRDIDSIGGSDLIIYCTENVQKNPALMDRLRKAAS